MQLECMYVGNRFFMPMGEQPPRIYPVVGSSSLHVQHLDAFVSRGLGRGLKINLVVARDHTYDMPRAVAREYQRLEYGGDILAQLLGHMCCGEVLLVNGIGYKFIRYAGLVEQACRICLFDLLL